MMKNFFKSKRYWIPGVFIALVSLPMVMAILRPSFINEYTTEKAIMRLNPPQEFIEGRVLKIVVTTTDHPWSDEEESRSTVIYLCSGETWFLELSESELHSIEHWAFVYTPKGCD